MSSGDDLRKAAPVAANSSNNVVSSSQTNEPGAYSLPQQNGHVFLELHYENNHAL